MFRNFRNAAMVKRLLNPVQSFANVKVESSGPMTRKLWLLSNSAQRNIQSLAALKAPHTSTACGCGCNQIHTKCEKDLVEFLTEEILTERKAQKADRLPNELNGFSIHGENADVTFVKKLPDEKITVSFNINHTVDADFDESEVGQSSNEEDFGELKSRPSFKIDINRNGSTLCFLCSFVSANNQDPDYNDKFAIDEVSIYEKEWNDKVYAVSGDIIDKYLYDLLMNFLEEKGISNKFVESLSEFSTTYEHHSYIQFLEKMSKFASRN